MKLKKKKKETEPVEPEPEVKLKEVQLNPHNHIKGMAKLKDRIWPEQTLLINMELRNGMHKTFMIKTKKRSFSFMGGTYIVDNELKYYNVDSKIWMLDYHQELSVPIKRRIPVADIKKAITASGMYEVENAINPNLVEEFMESKVSEGVMKGQQIDEFLKKLRLVLIVIAVTSVIHLLLFIFKTGMLKSIRIPGLM